MAPYVMPSPLALGGLGRLQCASTDRLTLLSKPKARAASQPQQRLPPLSSAGRRSQTARGEERTPRWAGVPCTAPHSHGFSMHYRRLEHPQSASVARETLVPKPPSNARMRLAPLCLPSPNKPHNINSIKVELISYLVPVHHSVKYWPWSQEILSLCSMLAARWCC